MIVWDRFHIRVPELNSTTKSYIPHLVTTDITKPTSIVSIFSGTNEIKCGLEALEFPPFHASPIVHALKFSLNVSRLENHIAKDLRLKVMGLGPADKFSGAVKTNRRKFPNESELSISIFKINNSITCNDYQSISIPDSQIQWNDNFRKGQVWVSPNLLSLFGNITITTKLLEFHIGIHGFEEAKLSSFFNQQDGPRGFCGNTKSLKSCFSPTITLKTENIVQK